MKPLKTTALAASMIAITTMAYAEPKEWPLDLGRAYIGWEVEHMNLSHTVGQFREFDGTFLIDEPEPANSQVAFTVQTASVDSNHKGRDMHVLSTDYFNVAKHAEMTFTSTGVQLLPPRLARSTAT